MIPIIRPTLPPYEDLEEDLKAILSSGMITHGKYVEAFEKQVARYLGVEEAIATSSCTTGLMLVLASLPPKSQVILPGFTFSGTYQALQWNDLEPVIVDVDDSCNIDPKEVEKAITPQTSAVVGVHVSGVPCQIDALEKICQKHNLKLFFDAAHALGSEYKGKKIGNFGTAEVFSLGATKILAVGEGGLIATNNKALARDLRLRVNHGHGPGDLDCVNKALNGRLEEINGLLGLKALPQLDDLIQRRLMIADYYKEHLKELPGITFPKIPENIRWTVKDFSIFIHPQAFGYSRDEVAEMLAQKGIQTKKYYTPPLHRLTILKETFKDLHLPKTEWMSQHVLSLPAYSHMPLEEVDQVISGLKEIYQSRKEG